MHGLKVIRNKERDTELKEALKKKVLEMWAKNSIVKIRHRKSESNTTNRYFLNS